MTTFKRNILITGGAGFIGSHVVRLFVNKYPEYRIINLDKLTYAGNLANLKDIENRPNYVFIKADICDYEKMQEADGACITWTVSFTWLQKAMWTAASRIRLPLHAPT